MKTIVLHNQSLLDLAVQHYGTATAAFYIALANDLSTTSILIPGQVLTMPEIDFGINEVASHYKNRNIQPATSWDEENSIIETQLEGISHWAINVDFVVTPATPEQLAELAQLSA